MSAFTTLRALINAQINTNGTKAITGAKLNGVLLQMVTELGAECQFGGLVLPSTPFTAGDFPVAFLATAAGTYTAFGGAVLDGAFLHILAWDGSAWSDTATDIPAGALEDYAKKDGYYASLTAGAALNLVGRGSVPAEFLFRTTGGTADVGTGAAGLAAIKGRSIVWNQFMYNNAGSGSSSGITYTSNADGSITIVADGTRTSEFTLNPNPSYPVSFVNGHKYLLRGCPMGGSNQTYNLRYNSNGFGETGNGAILTCDGGGGIGSIAINPVIVIQTGVEGTFVFRPMLIDLTLMFGAGNEPSTVAEFEKLFPLPYYAYNAGEVLPFAGEKLVTTGFNQWDEELETGSIDNTTGQNAIDNNKSRSANYIPVIAGMQYYTNTVIYRYYYDADKNYIPSAYDASGSNLFTIPANAAYMRFRQSTSDLPEHICINLSWSGIRNGEYEPYEKHELAVNPATLLDKDGNLVFPYGGMHGVGTAFDSMKPEADGFIHYANRVFARVNLGDFDYNVSDWNGALQFSPQGFDFQDYKAPYDADTVVNAICPGFVATTRNINYNNTQKLPMMSAVPQGFQFRHPTIETAEQFKAAMSGVYLYYEVATPEVVELAEPIAASYYANDWGTEEWQPANGSEPYTAPCNVDVQYAMNAVDLLRNLPRNYIGAEDFDTYNAALAQALASVGITMTYARTFDEQTDHHEFTITMAQSE